MTTSPGTQALRCTTRDMIHTEIVGIQLAQLVAALRRDSHDFMSVGNCLGCRYQHEFPTAAEEYCLI
jgi:hypothetical protein